MAQNLKALPEKYNERVAAVETDLSPFLSSFRFPV